MPTTISALPAIAFSQNEINLEITSDDVVEVAGVKAVIHILFKDEVTPGEDVLLKWPGAELTMVAADAPDESGNQFDAGDGGAAYVQALVAVFAANFYIDRDFVVSYALVGGFPAIVLTARSTGVIYNLQAQAGDVIEVAIGTPGVTDQMKPNFAHHLQVWLKRGDSFVQIIKSNLQLDANSTEKTTKNIAPLLHPYLPCSGANNFATDRPSLSATGWQACANTLLEYYCRYGQYHGTTPTVKKLTSTGSAYVNLGGLDVQTEADSNLLAWLRPDDDNSKTFCLRQGSKNIRVQKNQPEWLYWINITGVSKNIKLSVELFFTEGASYRYYLLPYAAAANAKCYVPVDFVTLGISANIPTGKTCTYYVVRIIDDAGAYLSVPYSYFIEGYKAYPRYFVYRNSLGGFQTLYTWGKGQQETDRTKTDVERLSTNAQAAGTGRMAETNIRLQQKHTVYTGYTTRRDIALLNDFLVSDEKYLVHGGRLIPVGVATDNLKQAMDGDNLNGASFSFMPMYDEVVFTDDNRESDGTINGNGGGATLGYNAIVDDGNELGTFYYDDL